MRKKVLLGMSGGVDSSVSALLLQEQGYEVIGVTMQLLDKENIESINDAKKVCQKLGIEHHVVDLKKVFKERVIENFICTYMCAKTPNPCVECNKYLKFGELFNIAKQFECDYIATGHYARIEYSNIYNQYVLAKSKSKLKDQTYFLYDIDKKILPNIIFPLSDYDDKNEIRKIAEERGLEIAQKKDSQEICFIENNNYIEFLQKQNPSKTIERGNIVLKNGKILGTHNGLIHYTIGQRKGIGISYQEPLYVIKLDSEKNEVVVGTEKELYSKELTAKNLNFLVDMNLQEGIEIQAKVRYRANPAKATLKVEGDFAKVVFEQEQRAITPGQSIVFYMDDIVLGGGKIM